MDPCCIWDIIVSQEDCCTSNPLLDGEKKQLRYGWNEWWLTYYFSYHRMLYLEAITEGASYAKIKFNKLGFKRYLFVSHIPWKKDDNKPLEYQMFTFFPHVSSETSKWHL